MKNRYPGTCRHCHGHVGEGEGQCEKREGDHRWSVYHVACRDRSEANAAVRDANCRTHTAEVAAPKPRPTMPNPFGTVDADDFLFDAEHNMCAEEELTQRGYNRDELWAFAKAAARKGCPAAMGAPETECHRYNLCEGSCEPCWAAGLTKKPEMVSLHLVEAL